MLTVSITLASWLAMFVGIDAMLIKASLDSLNGPTFGPIPEAPPSWGCA